MRCYNCGWDNPDGIQKCEKCNISLQDERWKLESELRNLQNDPPLYPPSKNAMCYCQRPPDWHKPNKYKKLIIWAIIVVAAIIIAIAFV